LKFSFEVGEKERHRVDFSWNHFLGFLDIKIDGKSARKDVFITSPSVSREQVTFLDKETEEKLKDIKRFMVTGRFWRFVVGNEERHEITIGKIRPVLLAGLRPHKYLIFIDGRLTEEFQGY